MSRSQSHSLGSVLVAAAIAFATWSVTRNHYLVQLDSLRYFTEDAVSELDPIAQKYGPGRYSRNVEEWAVRDFFQDRRDGVFVDVGANHYRDESNTYYLEHTLGWSGVAVDALEEFAADYLAYRPRTKFVAAFVADASDTTIEFFVPDANKRVASMSRAFTIKEGAPGQSRRVPTTTLNVLLDQADVRSLDFMSMDIELAEPKALAGFDIDRFAPRLVCIEAHPEVRQQILDYFATHGYVAVGKYLRADPKNLYFQQVSAP
jgi:FkbM family methyltransferase